MNGVSAKAMNDFKSSPVTVYDIDQKRPLLVFNNLKTCARFVFNKPEKSVDSYVKSRTIKTKEKNVLDKNITFRIANTQQRELLADNDIYIYDTDLKTRINGSYDGGFRYKVKDDRIKAVA